MGGGVGGTPQGAPFIFFPKPVVSEGKERENPRWITVRLRHSFTTPGSGNIMKHSWNYSCVMSQILFTKNNRYHFVGSFCSRSKKKENAGITSTSKHFLHKTNAYRLNCSRALWSPSSWLSGRLSSSGQSGIHSLKRTDRKVGRQTGRRVSWVVRKWPKNCITPLLRVCLPHRHSWSEVYISLMWCVGGDRGSGSTPPPPLLPPLPWLHPELWSQTWWVALDQHETDETHTKNKN